MAKYNDHVNRRVNADAAERLQERLFVAAELALDKAIEAGEVPASLLSATNTILKDQNIAIDLTSGKEEEEVQANYAPRWVQDLERELGL